MGMVVCSRRLSRQCLHFPPPLPHSYPCSYSYSYSYLSPYLYHHHHRSLALSSKNSSLCSRKPVVVMSGPESPIWSLCSALSVMRTLECLSQTCTYRLGLHHHDCGTLVIDGPLHPK